ACLRRWPPVSDPTLRILESLKDPEQWDLIDDNVPVFKPHVRTEQGHEIVVDEERLRELARLLNAKEKATGGLIRWTEGHTKLVTGADGKRHVADQKDQPAILAYSQGARVDRWGPGREWGLLVTLYVPRGMRSRIKKYPFRSLEFYPKELTGKEDDAT